MSQQLAALIRREQAWLTAKIATLADRHGFAGAGPELLAGWEASVAGFLEPIDRAAAEPALLERLDADIDYARHPLTAYGIAAARRHRGRGASLTGFLTLLKHFRRAHLALLAHAGYRGAARERARGFLDGVFDLIEVGVVAEWASLGQDAHLDELRAANRTSVAERLKYLTVFESVASPVVILDDEGRIENANWAAIRTFASAPEALAAPGGGYYRGRLPRLLVERVEALLAAAAEERSIRLDTVHGERHFRVTARPLLAVTGDRAGRVVLLADVTDYVSELAEAQLVNRAKSAFIATMSHEIRTPLAGILGAAELIALDDARGHGAADETLAAIRSSARVLLNLVDDILDHARLQAGTVVARPAPVRLDQLLRAAARAIEPRSRGKGLVLATAIAPAVATTAEVDAAKLQRIVVNLLDNAVKFTARGEVRLDADLEGDALRVAVVDTGRGFDPQRLERLFEPFVQETAGDDAAAGAGLGLAICRRLAAVLGGRLDASSAPGAGTRFVLRVPLGAATAALPSDAEPALLERGARVLLVEDDEVNRTVTAGLLARAGYAVTPVARAAEAERVAAAGIDAVVLDLRLPDGDGQALTRRLRARSPELPIVALTAYLGDEEEIASRRAGVSAYLTKPAGLPLLDATLRRLLAGRGTPPRPAADSVDRARLAGHFEVLGEGALRALVRAFDRAGERALAAARAGPVEAEGGVDDALHALKGAAAQLGLDGIAARVDGLQLTADGGDPARLEREVATFARDLEAAQAALIRAIDALAGHPAPAGGTSAPPQASSSQRKT